MRWGLIILYSRKIWWGIKFGDLPPKLLTIYVWRSHTELPNLFMLVEANPPNLIPTKFFGYTVYKVVSRGQTLLSHLATRDYIWGLLLFLYKLKLYVIVFSEFDASNSDHAHEKHRHYHKANNTNTDDEAIWNCMVMIKYYIHSLSKCPALETERDPLQFGQNLLVSHFFFTLPPFFVCY